MYDAMLKKSNDIWDEFTTGKHKHKQRLNEAQHKKNNQSMMPGSSFKTPNEVTRK